MNITTQLNTTFPNSKALHATATPKFPTPDVTTSDGPNSPPLPPKPRKVSLPGFYLGLKIRKGEGRGEWEGMVSIKLWVMYTYVIGPTCRGDVATWV